MAQVFPCEFGEISKNTFFYRTPPVATSATFFSSEITCQSKIDSLSNCFEQKLEF